MSPCRRHSKRGLTFVELLVALSLVGMVAAAALAVFSGGFRIWERAEQLGVRDRQVHLVMEQLRRELSSMRTFGPIPLEGEYDELSFAGIVKVPYRNDDGDEFDLPEVGRIAYVFDSGRRLLGRSAHSYRTTRRYGPRDRLKPMLDETQRVRFSYYMKDAEGQGSWTSGWDSPSLPLAVKVEVDGRTMIVPLPTGTGEKKESS